MIASLRGLLVAGVLALVLAVALVVDVAHTTAPVSHALAPGFDPDRIGALRWPDMQVQNVDGRWLVCSGDAPMCMGWTADPAALDAIRAALRGATWHRRAPASAAGKVTRTLVVGLGGTSLSFGLGAPVEGTDQRWLVERGDALLVDGWVARTLFPDLGTLIDRDVFPGVVGASEIDIGGVVITEGCRVAGMWVDPARCDQVEQALAAVKVDTILPHAAAVDAGGETVRYRTRAGGKHGAAKGRDAACTGSRIAIIGDAGSACVDAAAWQAAFTAAKPLAGPPEAIVDRRPLPIAPAKLDLPGGAHLDVTAMQLDGKDADRDQVAQLLAALAAPAEVVPLRFDKPTATFVATDRAGTTVKLDVFGDIVARRGESVALRPSREALATITRPASALLDPTRWVEDPLAVTELAIDGTTYKRGGVVGEWTSQPAGTVDPVALEALATALSHVRAPAITTVGPMVHRVVVQLAPPVGTPQTHVLEVDAHCAARLDGAAVQLDPGICAALEKIRNRTGAGAH